MEEYSDIGGGISYQLINLVKGVPSRKKEPYFKRAKHLFQPGYFSAFLSQIIGNKIPINVFVCLVVG